MTKTTIPSELDILEEFVAPDKADGTVEGAREILRIKISASTQRKISRLLRLNNLGKISAEERLTLDRYVRMGTLIDLLQAKARNTLKKAGVSA